MSESLINGTESTGVYSGGTAPASAGSLIRRARESAGLHIAALAVALKVPVGKLQSLEADDYSSMPDVVFVRALASSVCRALKIDPGPVLDLLPKSQQPALVDNSAGLNAPVKAFAGRHYPGILVRTKSPAMSYAIIALLAGALLLVFLPQDVSLPGWWSGTDTTGTPESAAVANESTLAVASVASSNTAAESAPVVPAPRVAPDNVDQNVGRPAAVSAASLGGALSVRQESSSTPEAASSAMAAGAGGNVEKPSSPLAGPLVLRARAISWVQVRDAAGAILLQRNLAAGEEVALAGPLPLAVVVGRADATEALVRGKSLDLIGIARENVARFEVK